MAAVTADNTVLIPSKQLPVDGFVIDFQVAAATTIYKNTFVGLDTTGGLTSFVAGINAVMTNATTMVGTSLRGIALESVDNSTGAIGDKTCSVQVTGFFTHTCTGATVLDVGHPVYAVDNATIGLTQTAADGTIGNYEPIGTIAYVPATSTVVVDMGTPASRSGWIGGMKTVVRGVDAAATLNHGVWLLHPTDQPRCFLHSGNAIISETGVGTTDNGEVTIVHTPGTDTALCGIMTVIHTAVVADLAVITRPGIAVGNAVVSADNMIHVAANVGIAAKVTTLMGGGAIAGQARVFATFMAT